MGEPPLAGKSKAAKIPARRESTRTVKKPNRDLPEEPQVVSLVLEIIFLDSLVWWDTEKNWRDICQVGLVLKTQSIEYCYAVHEFTK